MEKCLLCDYVKCGGGNTFQCGRSGIKTIIKCSEIREDGAGQLFKEKTSVELHVECRKIYTKRPKAPTAPDQVQKSTRLLTTGFDFKLHCLFCDRLVDVQHPDRMSFCQVGTLEIIQSICRYAVKRNDQWGKNVTNKLTTVSDLVAAEGRYHRECYNYFKRVGSSLPGSSSAQGRKGDAIKIAGFDKLCQELEEDCDECQYTLAQLILKIKQYDPNHETYSEKHLKRKLKDKVQEWLGNPLPPTDWGFEKDEEGHLRPVTNRSKPAPDRLLEMVSCNCTQACETRNCSCRKYKMVYSNICGHCAGHGCSNTLREENEDSGDDPDGYLEPIPSTGTSPNI